MQQLAGRELYLCAPPPPPHGEVRDRSSAAIFRRLKAAGRLAENGFKNGFIIRYQTVI